MIMEYKSKFALLHFNENPNIGVYCRTNDSVVFLQKNLQKKVKNKIASTLDANIVELSVSDSSIVGSLLALNSRGVVITDFVDTKTVNKIKNQGLDVFVVKDVINAAGNDILANDNGALIHPDIRDYSMKKIGEKLGVPAGIMLDLPGYKRRTGGIADVFKDQLEFASAQDVDFIALSFITSAEHSLSTRESTPRSRHCLVLV